MQKKDEREEKNILHSKHFIWATHKRKELSMFIITIMLFAFVASFKLHFFQKNKYEDLQIVDQTYQDWMATGEENLLDKMLLSMKKNSFLLPKYEGKITQHLIDKRLEKEVNLFANNTLRRTQKDLGFYNEWTQGTLLINEKKFSDALSQAKGLKKQLLHNKLAKTVLFTSTLLRISLLEKKLGNENAELLAWQELQEHLNSAQRENKQLLENFSQQYNIELADFISYRKNLLSSR